LHDEHESVDLKSGTEHESVASKSHDDYQSIDSNFLNEHEFVASKLPA
jgi:hypothetical protein